MARLNIEDSLLAGKRFEKLMLRLGSKRAALGAVAEAWLVAQRFWKHSDAGVPRKAWELEELAPELIDVGLAEDRGDFIYIKGSAEHFAWLRQKVEAGKTGAKVTNEKRWGSGEAGREIIDEKSQRRSADVGVRSASPSSSLLSSLPQDSNLKNNLPTAPKKPPLSREVEKAYGVWLETLEHFGIDRTEIALPQETSIARAIGTLGLENVCLALEGARYEKPNEKFDPKRHLSIDRALHRDRHGKSRWEEFKYMALAERKRRASRAETAQGATSSGDEADSYIERERARAAAEFERDFGAGGAT